MKRVVEVFEDDLEGGKADVTISFALDSKVYEIDLSTENADQLRAALQPFIAVARPVGTATGQSRRSPVRSVGGPSPAQVREWARANGYQINERGRIPSQVLAAYVEAQTAA